MTERVLSFESLVALSGTLAVEVESSIALRTSVALDRREMVSTFHAFVVPSHARIRPLIWCSWMVAIASMISSMPSAT
jgi:hypothetical protein